GCWRRACGACALAGPEARRPGDGAGRWGGTGCFGRSAAWAPAGGGAPLLPGPGRRGRGAAGVQTRRGGGGFGRGAMVGGRWGAAPPASERSAVSAPGMAAPSGGSAGSDLDLASGGVLDRQAHLGEAVADGVGGREVPGLAGLG